MMNDPYDNGIPKYTFAQDIYEGLEAMASGEEIGILSDLFADVSWENQDYYYADNGNKLVERWEEATDYGNKMWIMDVAAWQLSDEDANNCIYEILCNDDLAKRIGFKKIFVETVLSGMESRYKAVIEKFEAELQELNRFDYYSNLMALQKAMTSVGLNSVINPYSKLLSAVYSKLKGLKLDKEKQLIVESRAMLTAYDDFMFGLRANQALYNEQEQMYQRKVALLQSAYDEKVKQLFLMAEQQGVKLIADESIKMLTV